MAQSEYKSTVFSVKVDRQRKIQPTNPEPPKGDGWQLINFQPIQHPEPTQNWFVAVWERATE